MQTGARILILGASAGHGHMIAARALEQAFRERCPRATVEMLDVLALCNPLFRRFYADGYSGIVRHAPAAMGWLYESMDRPRGTLQDAVRVWIQNFNKLPIVRFLRQWRPDLVVSTHYLPAEIIAQMRRAGQFQCPQVIVTTDFETHRIWVQEPCERYYTATTDGKAYLMLCGAEAERIKVTGIPVRRGFDQTLSAAEARRRCGLEENRPIVLMIASGFDVGPTVRLMHELLTMSADAVVVGIAGRLKQLRQRLEAQARAASRMTHVIGYTERMHEWMRAVDVVVTKPGGLTVSEALACGLPMVIVNPIPGQETRNSDYLLERGAAIKVNNPRLLGHRVGALLEHQERLHALRTAAAAMGRPLAASVIVADALEAAAITPH